MKKLPKDPIRRKIWAVKVKRNGWKPTNASVLCEAHFDETMWEKIRVDGSRKLKHDVVPTTFVFVSPRKTRKLPTKRILTTSEDIPIVSTHIDESLAQLQLEPIAGPSNVAVTNIENAHDADSLFVSVSSEEVECNELLLQTKVCNKAYKKVALKLIHYKRLVRSLKRKQRVKQTGYKLLRKVFGEDQILALNRKSTKFMKWSNTTVQNALKLKFSCGNNGYQELLRQNMPLPSLRTLRRRMQHLKFDSGILHEVFNFFRIKVNTFYMISHSYIFLN
ncbi:Transposase protein [Popillia japonica]|uniref:Transposase protein n=1 Tax=Popillia japonica TaxID=7064 RepID=A0AAW1H5R4_POPJA